MLPASELHQLHTRKVLDLRGCQLNSEGAMAVPASYGLMFSGKHCSKSELCYHFNITRVLSLSRHHISVPYHGGYSAAALHLTTMCSNKTRFRYICSVQEAQESLQVIEHERGRWGRYLSVA